MFVPIWYLLTLPNNTTQQINNETLPNMFDDGQREEYNVETKQLLTASLITYYSFISTSLSTIENLR